jgi:hypothetical protein
MRDIGGKVILHDQDIEMSYNSLGESRALHGSRDMSISSTNSL